MAQAGGRANELDADALTSTSAAGRLSTSGPAEGVLRLQRAAGNQAVARLLSEGGAGESFAAPPVGWSGAQRSMRVGNGAVVSVFPSARPIFRLVEGGAGQIQREGDDEIPQDMKLGGSALSSAVTRLYYAMSPILALPGKAKAIALGTTYPEAVQLWEGMTSAIDQLVTEQSNLPPVDAPEDVREAEAERKRMLERTKRKLKKYRKSGKTYTDTKNIPLLNKITRGIAKGRKRKLDEAGEEQTEQFRNFEGLSRAYDDYVLEVVQSSDGAKAFLSAKGEINSFLKKTGADRTDMDNLDMIFRDIVALRRDPLLRPRMPNGEFV